MRITALIIFLAVAGPLDILAQSARTFKVENLSAPKTPVFPSVSYQRILEDLIREDRKLPGSKSESDLSGEANIIAKSDIKEPLMNRGFHPFFEGMYAAYADHHPFTLSPDMIWLLISQGFANHINNNAEQLRHKFVKFDEKRTLKFEAESSMLSADYAWGKVFLSLTNQIGDYAGRQLTQTVTADFTTTTMATRIASQITLMNAVSAYFNYQGVIRSCGIPKITLEGTPSDWQRLLIKTQALKQYELDWWIDEMEPILKQFIQASKGNINKKFWMNMFGKHTTQPGCGPKQDIVDGWIVKFFPYDKKGDRMELKEINLGRWMPNEMLKVDFEYADIQSPVDTIKTKLELWAGFVGIEQDSKTHGLKPRIGWMVRKKDRYRQAIVERLAADNKKIEGLALKVDNVPPELFAIGPVNKLILTFFGNIRIPDEMKTIEIGELTITGTTQPPEVDRIVKLFPKTKLHINGVDYN